MFPSHCNCMLQSRTEKPTFNHHFAKLVVERWANLGINNLIGMMSMKEACPTESNLLLATIVRFHDKHSNLSQQDVASDSVFGRALSLPNKRTVLTCWQPAFVSLQAGPVGQFSDAPRSIGQAFVCWHSSA